MNLSNLLTDYGISQAPPGHKHHRPGWVNMACPFCEGSAGFHLGYSLQDNYFRCWRCGWKNRIQAISKLCGVTQTEAQSVLHKYQGRATQAERGLDTPPSLPKTPFALPSGVGPLLPHHKQYLKGRNFSPGQLETEWGLLSTGPVSTLDQAQYKHRVLAPIHWEGEMVSFQARDVSGKSPLKYKACLKSRELIHHKRILYGKEENWHGFGIVVEGITDVWRFGGLACAVFGINYIPAQVKLLAQIFTEVVVVFDEEPQAQAQAGKLVNELRFRGVRARQETIPGDPGGMLQQEADEFVKEITLRRSNGRLW